MGKRVATHHPHVRLRRDTAATRPGARPLALVALCAHASARAQPRGSTGFSWEDVDLETGWWSTAGKLQRVYGLWQRLPAKSKQSPYAPCAAVRLRVAAAATGAPAGVARAGPGRVAREPLEPCLHHARRDAAERVKRHPHLPPALPAGWGAADPVPRLTRCGCNATLARRGRSRDRLGDSLAKPAFGDR